MLSSNALLPGDNTEIQAGGVKKSVSSREQISKTGKLNPNRAASKWQGRPGMQTQLASLLGQKVPRSSRLGCTGFPPEERGRERGELANAETWKWGRSGQSLAIFGWVDGRC